MYVFFDTPMKVAKNLFEQICYICLNCNINSHKKNADGLFNEMIGDKAFSNSAHVSPLQGTKE
jgi:hypothetical protein